MTELNHMYLSHPALWAEDYERDGFAWLDCHQEEKCVYIIRRRSEEETIIAAFNFSVRKQMAGIESGGAQWRILLETNLEKYGGNASEQDRSSDWECPHTADPGTFLRCAFYGVGLHIVMPEVS